ncbi:gamma-glutamyltransferase [Merismopedia glauca CCAP 1448/3]|uniref:Glutathione hydrolase proenzyme n=2 Tax=Merismopedia TaxID=53402 RepID=A0A2T1BYM5_9CYAN|nr:gamma-glutamyltransferase [Merismopedia glauca CCAP 1448/3]
MALFGSVYHPLTYLYNGASWILCQNTIAPSCVRTSEPEAYRSSPKSTATLARKEMVVTTHHLASKVGEQILAQGGNAIDAAVAIGYALAVVDPCCGNIGGGGFMLIRLANGKEIFLNFRERAPLAATPDMYLDAQGKPIKSLSTQGYLAVGVPGTVKGLDTALSKYGTMSRTQVMAPAIALAKVGFILYDADAKILQQAKSKVQSDPAASAIFLKQGSRVYQSGDRPIQTDLARTLETISQQGVDAFYQGQIAREIASYSQKQGGILQIEDFTNYKVTESPPLRCSYRGYEVVTTPPPGGGVTLCQMLNILEGYQIPKLERTSSQRWHLMLSAMFFAYRDRNTYLGDPDFVNIPVKRLLSADYTRSLRAQIPQQQALSPKSDTNTPEGNNTTHYSVIDRQGNAVSVTYTINSYFGAGVVAGNTGFLLNNEMDDFTAKVGVANSYGLKQGEKNAIAPFKQPLSSMSPTIVLKDGKPLLITGSPGGSTIPTTVLQVISNVIDYGMSVESAVNTPRIHYQGSPNWVLTEPFALPSQTVQQLWDRGYKVVPFVSWGAAESIGIDREMREIWGVNDVRKPAGAAAGN